MLVRYEQEITCLRIAFAVAGLDEVAKNLRKFLDAKEKEVIESSEVGVDNELPPVVEEEVRGRR